MTALAILIALGPLTGPAAAIAGARARLAAAAQAAGAAIALGCSIALLVMLDGRAPLFGWDGFLYVDSLGGFFLMTVAGVTLLAAVGSIGYIAAQEDSGELGRFQVRLYFTFFGLFASLMLAALETGNLGLLFVLVEAARWPARPWSAWRVGHGRWRRRGSTSSSAPWASRSRWRARCSCSTQAVPCTSARISA